MKLLITGGAGFIGSNFVKHILAKYPEYKIINLDKLTYCGNLDNLIEIKNNPNHTFIQGDICDKELVESLMAQADAVVNFAAETHVDRSITDAGSFIQTDVVGTYTLLEAARKNDIKKFVHISCYDEKTRALTSKGLKNYSELNKGDVVFSLNLKTNRLEEKRVEKVIIQDYKGEMIHFKSNRVDLLVTPNHRIYYQKRFSKTNKIHIDEARVISNKTGLSLPYKFKWKGKGIGKKSIKIEGIGQVNTYDLFYLSGLFIGDGFTAYQEKEVETKSGLNRIEFLKQARDNLGKFCSLEKKQDYESLCKSYRIFFDIPEKDKARKKLEEILKRLNIKFSRHKGKSGEHIYFSSKDWLKYFEQFGKYAKDKHIPKWMLKYNQKPLKYLFDGLIDSDGYKRKSDFQYTTISNGLLSSITELGYKLGYRVVFKDRKCKSYINKRKIEGRVFYIYFSKQPKGISKINAKKKLYNGKIWCVKVEDNKNLIVERNGKFDICGNTDEVYGQIHEGEFKETDELKPRNPYSASKAAADRLAYSFYATYDIPVLITRSSNNFGQNQYPEKLIPLFVTNLLEGKKVPVYGDGLNVRDWLYVLDNCEAINHVMEKGKLGEVYNIGGGNEKTNIEITKFILSELGKNESHIEHVKDRPGHDKRYALDCSKIQALGWAPRFEFNQALKETVNWYLKNPAWWKKVKNRSFEEYYKKQYGDKN